MSQERP